MSRRAWLSWSSGKDSAWALHTVRRQGAVEIIGLLTTINDAASRVAMHAVREKLVEMQAAAVGLPLVKVPIPSPCSNDEYERAMAAAMRRARDESIEAMVFGDLFLEDVRRYREDKLAPTGIEPLFPLWGADTARLARAMVDAGVRAYLTCVNPAHLDAAFAGRVLDNDLLDALPASVDPCGERGEFHTFVFDGPLFDRPLPVAAGEVVERDGYVFADVVSVESSGRDHDTAAQKQDA